MKKGQASFDFLILLGVLLIFFVFLFQFILSGRYTESVQTQIALGAREEAEHVAFVVDSLYLSGEGSNTTFYVGSSLAHNTNFTLLVYDEGFVVVNYMNTEYSVALLTTSVNQTQLSSGSHFAENRNGVIVFA